MVGRVTKDYISSIEFLDKREILDQVLDTTSEDATILDIMEMTGRMVVTDVPKYHHFTNDYIFTSGTFSAVSTTPGENGNRVSNVNNPLVVTLSSEAQTPIVGDLALLSNKRQGRVSSVNKTNPAAPVVTITPFDNLASNQLAPVALVSGDKVSFFSGAYGEGTDAPEGKRPKFKRSENNVQIFKTYREITDLQKVSAIEVNYGGKPYVLYKVQHDALLEHRGKIAFQFLIGIKADYNDTDGNRVLQTQGLRQYLLNGDGTVMTTGGINQALSGTIQKSDFRTMSRALDKVGAGPEYWLWAGGDIDADIDDMITALGNLTSGGIQYNSWGIGNGQKRAIDLGVTSFKLYNRTFHKKKLVAYDHPEVFAPSAAFNYASEAYLIPTGKVKVDHSGNKIDAIRTRYMSADGTDFGKWNEVLTGALAPVPTSNKAVLGISYETIMGLEVAGVRQFGIFSKA